MAQKSISEKTLETIVEWIIDYFFGSKGVNRSIMNGATIFLKRVLYQYNLRNGGASKIRLFQYFGFMLSTGSVL